jgi:hypothetical protein
MSFAKKTLPLIVGMTVGIYALAEFYMPHHAVKDFTGDLLNWAAILTATAYVLGAVNVMQFNWPRIRRRERDWQFKVVMLAAAVVMFTVGMMNLVTDPGPPGKTDPIKRGADQAALAAGKAVVIFDAPDDVLVSAGGQPAKPGRNGNEAARFEVDPGAVGFKAYRLVAGYVEYNEGVWAGQQPAPAKDQPAPTAPVLAAGDVLIVHSDPPMKWGKEGRPFVWLYDHVFAPCNATMFALLAFFVASAAFRAFRARNVEAGLLLGGAILVMLGRVPIGRLISETLPSIAQWILDVPNNGSRRAIMMGAAIGAITTGMRILLGIERSHIGSDE